MIELLCVIAIIALLAALLLPVVSQGQGKAHRLQCVNHLKQAGVAFHTFMHDHNGRFPMQLSMAQSGTLEFVHNGYRVAGDFYFSFRHFQALSNELQAPKLVVCPSDLERIPAASFSRLKNENVSYFVGVNANYSNPQSVLAGDRNIYKVGSNTTTILRVNAENVIRWTAEIHRYKGNLLFADGHVEQVKSLGYEMANADYFLPTTQPGTVAGGGNGGGGGSSGGGSSGSGSGNSGSGSSTVPPGNSTPSPDEGETPKDNTGTPVSPRSGDAGANAFSSPTVMAQSTASELPAPTSRPPTPTNPPPSTAGSAGPAPTTDSGESPFAQWIAWFAKELLHWAKWILLLLLALLLVFFVLMRLRYLASRKREAGHAD